MEFCFESDLTGLAGDWLRSEGLLVKEQFRTPWGICDLVGCRLNQDRVNRRLSRQRRNAIGPELRVSLLLRMPDEDATRGVSLSGLARAYSPYIPLERIQREVKKLIDWHFAVVTRSGSFKRANGWMPLHDRLVAVELKLSRISEALEQACANQGFANESFVGLPGDVAQRVASSIDKTRFLEKGIGVLGIAENRCTVYIRARPVKPLLERCEVHAVERFWRDYLRLS